MVQMSERGVKRSSRLKVSDFQLELKAVGDAEAGVFEGYGSVFGTVDSYNEIVAPGAFAESLADMAAKKRKVPVLWQHRTGQPIGVYEELREDENGLYVRGRLLVDDVALAREAYALLKAEAVSGLSIGYWVREDSFDDLTRQRTLKRLDLIEVSLVTFPANDDARVESLKMKMAHGQLPDLKEFETLLRDAGFSKSQAVIVANHGMAHLLRSESAGSGEIDQEAKSILSDMSGELAGLSQALKLT